MSKKVLVSGGLGYIGSHTVVELQKSGFEPLILDNLSNSSPQVAGLIGRITGNRPFFEQTDLCDFDALEGFFGRQGPLAGVIHFAAFKAVGESVAKPLKYYHNNLLSLINLLRCMGLHGSPPLVFSSSASVYGQPARLPVTEKAALQPPASPYGQSKQMGERIVDDAAKAGQVRAISLRYFNPVGAHESGLIGELPPGIPDNLVPYITQTAIGKRVRLSVFGKDYNTPDGTAIRDYIHVSDLGRAHVTALERLSKGNNASGHEIFNLGTGKGYSVLEVITAFEKATGVKLNWDFAPRRAGDVESVWADTTLANLKLGWKAEKGLEEMMVSAWKWEKNLSAGILDQ